MSKVVAFIVGEKNFTPLDIGGKRLLDGNGNLVGKCIRHNLEPIRGIMDSSGNKVTAVLCGKFDICGNSCPNVVPTTKDSTDYDLVNKEGNKIKRVGD